MKEIFTKKYDNHSWMGGSGWGSWPSNTLPYVNFLNKFIKEHDIKSVVDVGCGDWQFSKFVDWDGVEYVGLDVVDNVIAENVKLYQKHNIRFECVDVMTHSLPTADLILVKDVLMHWTPDIIEQFLANLPQYRFLLSTNTHTDTNTINTKYRVGAIHNVDLHNAEMVLEYQFQHPRIPQLLETKRTFLMRN